MSQTPRRQNRPIPEPWGSIAELSLTRTLEARNLPAGNTAAAAAETARIMFRWGSDDSEQTPPNTMGFHAGFIRNIDERRATRSRLEQIVQDAIAALDRTCGVGSVVIHIHGECRPDTALLPVTPHLVRSNCLVRASDTLARNPAFTPALAHMDELNMSFIATLFLRDWRQRATACRYFTPGTVLLQPVENLLPSDGMPSSSHPTAPSSPSSTPPSPAPPSSAPPSPAPRSHPFRSPPPPSPAPTSASGRPTYYMPDPLRSTGASTFGVSMPSLASQMAGMSMGSQAAGQEATGSSSQAVPDDMSSFTTVNTPVISLILPPSVVDFLQDMDADSGTVLMIEEIFEDRARRGWSEDLRRIGYHAGTANALAALMRQEI